MNYGYVKAGSFYRVSDEAGEFVCYVRKIRESVWTAWTDDNPRGRTALTRSSAVKLLVETPAQ